MPRPGPLRGWAPGPEPPPRPPGLCHLCPRCPAPNVGLLVGSVPHTPEPPPGQTTTSQGRNQPCTSLRDRAQAGSGPRARLAQVSADPAGASCLLHPAPRDCHLLQLCLPCGPRAGLHTLRCTLPGATPMPAFHTPRAGTRGWGWSSPRYRPWSAKVSGLVTMQRRSGHHGQHGALHCPPPACWPPLLPPPPLAPGPALCLHGPCLCVPSPL